MNSYTDITVLLDRSGSMASIKTDMEGGYKAYLEKLRKDNIEARISLFQFDTVYDRVYEGVPIGAAQPFVLEPRGGTALIDAMCKCIDDTGNRLRAMKESDRPERVMMIVITDGEENSSVEFKREDLKNRIKTQTDTYKWGFVYLGANQDAFTVGQNLGIARASIGNYGNHADGVSTMFAAAACTTSNYANSGDLSVDQTQIQQ